MRQGVLSETRTNPGERGNLAGATTSVCVERSWAAYRDAVRHLVIDVDWDELVSTCARLEIDVRFVWGARDRVGDRRHAERLTRGRAVEVDVLDHGDHRLPLTDPATCIAHLTERLA